MIRVREAHARDVGTIRDVFHACSGDDYPYAQFYDLDGLMRMVYSENQVLLVAEETETLRVAGTASVVLEAKAEVRARRVGACTVRAGFAVRA